MTRQREQKWSQAGSDPLDELEIQQLLESAGRRPEVPPGDLAMIKAAARAEWQEAVAARQRSSRFALPLALAASLILALAVGWWWFRQGTPIARDVVATVERLEGDVELRGPPDFGPPARLAVGQTLVAGAELATVQGPAGQPARLAIRLASGSSLRLDTGTSLQLRSSTSLELKTGAVYFDSGAARTSGRTIDISTPFGEVYDVGTQFEVRLADAEAPLRVRVREGAVSVVTGAETHSAQAGVELTLGADGSVARGAVAPYGPAWEWVLAAAPTLDTAGVSLGAYLDWLSRETGWQVRYADEALAASVTGIRLYAPIEGLSPDESVGVVVPSSGLGYRLEDGTLMITESDLSR